MSNTAFIIGREIEVTETSATPAPPPTGALLLYPKTDDKWYQQNSAGVETQLGSGSGTSTPGRTFFMSGG